MEAEEIATRPVRRPVAITPALVLSLFLLVPDAHAVEPNLHVRAYNPFTQIFGRPEFFAGSMCEPGSGQLRGSISVVSYSELEVASGNSLELDGETYHFDLNYDRVVAPGLELGIRVPVLHHTGGGMDGPLTDWHELLGVPNGKRDLQPADQLRLYFEDGNGTTVLREDVGTGLGDVQLWSRYRLTPGLGGRQMSLHAGLKTPTGKAERLTGSGAFDVSLGLGYSDPLSLRWLRTSISANLGVVILGDAEVMAEYQRPSVLFAGVQVGIQLSRRFTLLGGVQGSTPYYDTDVGAIGDNTVQFSLGGNYRMDSGWDMRFGIVEDGITRVMPDFSLHFEVSRSMGRAASEAER